MNTQVYLWMKLIFRFYKTSCFITSLFLISIHGYAAETKIQKNLFMELEAGLGYDSNIYRAPDTAYVDYGKNAPPYPVITPQTYSGMFIPLRFQLKHNNALNSNNTLVTQYKFKGSFYTDSQFDNANIQHHHVAVGNTTDFSVQEKQNKTLYTGVFIGYRDRLYVDRDTGENQQSGPNDLSDRYTYNYYGAELNYDYENGALEYIVQLDFESRDYKTTPGSILEYDNIQLGVAGEIKWKIAKLTKLYAGIEAYNVDYDKRPARDTNGDLFKSNPKRNYDYTILSVGLRQRFNRSWLLYLDVVNKQRMDNYVGYDDYSKLLYKARLHYRINNQNKLKLTVSMWEREYDNAFAFDNNTQAKKYYEGDSIKLASVTQLTDTTVLKFSYQQKNQDTTDLRYVYDRTLAMASVEWNF